MLRHMLTEVAVVPERHVKLFKNGRNQAVRIPREFELPGEDAIMRKEGERLIIEPTPPKSLLALLATLAPLDEDFPPIPDSAPDPVSFERYLLDTNVVSDLIRNPQGRVAEHIRKVGEAQVCTSIIVAAELRYGATKKGSPRLTAQLEAVLGALDVLPFEAPADATYGLIRTRLEQAGRPIGGNDLLIAAQAIALGYAIVTDNEGEFARIDGLPRENWLQQT
jgi:tRNA(fMet)-specific endonuclease VapC